MRRVWTDEMISVAKSDVQILSKAQAEEDGDYVADSVNKHVEFLTCPEESGIDIVAAVVDDLLPPLLLHYLAGMFLTPIYYSFWPTEDLCRELVGHISDTLKFALRPKQSPTDIRLVLKLNKNDPPDYYAYRPINDLYVTDQGNSKSHPLVLWGEIDSHCSGYDHTKGLFAVHTYAKVWITQKRANCPTRFLNLFVSDDSQFRFVTKFTIFKVVENQSQPGKLELRRYARLMTRTEFEGAVEFVKVCAGLFMGMRTMVTNSRAHSDHTVQTWSILHNMLSVFPSKAQGASKHKNQDKHGGEMEVFNAAKFSTPRPFSDFHPWVKRRHLTSGGHWEIPRKQHSDIESDRSLGKTRVLLVKSSILESLSF
ncbi:hypothetical protein E1B28_001796 [Marasmius oreades]|uniref:Uncharacterized protein n=1 Tax=Marasmius oreades TaxID=181124 RepID=A0A9P7V4B9_9AGAR|nr:uncharacterized protein E1B28_001796 [Marasmius oreades]KAG7100009.1 hypothetical protein E1B28_001796 [Marasmius oreades]